MKNETTRFCGSERDTEFPVTSREIERDPLPRRDGKSNSDVFNARPKEPNGRRVESSTYGGGCGGGGRSTGRYGGTVTAVLRLVGLRTVQHAAITAADE